MAVAIKTPSLVYMWPIDIPLALEVLGLSIRYNNQSEKSKSL